MPARRKLHKRPSKGRRLLKRMRRQRILAHQAMENVGANVVSDPPASVVSDPPAIV